MRTRYLAACAGVCPAVMLGALSLDTTPLTAAAQAGNAPTIQVLLNQIGFDRTSAKRFVVAAGAEAASGTFVLLDDTGREVHQGELEAAGRIYGGTNDDWGWNYWQGDFSSWRRLGTYRVRAKVGSAAGESHRFRIAPRFLFEETANLATQFFFVQRCGGEVPGWHKACHLDDARLPDGAHRDLTGGWHDAGDYNKWMGDWNQSGSAYALVTAYLANRDYFDRFDRDRDGRADILDEALWGARFLARMQDSSTGGLLNNIHRSKTPGSFIAPEAETDNQPGTEDDRIVDAGFASAPLAAAAFARLSALLPAGNDYRERAERLWAFEHRNTEKAGDPRPTALLASLDLFDVTGSERYREAARAAARVILAKQVPDGECRGAFSRVTEIVGQGVPAAALARFAHQFPKDPLRPELLKSLRAYMDFSLRTSDNPFHVARYYDGQRWTFFRQSVPPSSWTVGGSSQYLSQSWAANLIHTLTRDARYRQYAVDQIDWVLGRNPLDLCMFEGRGSVNPPGYHHRYSRIPGHERGAVPGAIPNGIIGISRGPDRYEDRPWLDLDATGGWQYRSNEPWIPHNAFFLLAIATLPAP